MERMTESAKAVVDHFGEHIAYVNVLRNMSVSCDCEGVRGRAGGDPQHRHRGLARTSWPWTRRRVDLVYALKEEEHHDLVERMETRHGLRQLTYMKELGMGNDRYALLRHRQRRRAHRPRRGRARRQALPLIAKKGASTTKNAG